MEKDIKNTLSDTVEVCDICGNDEYFISAQSFNGKGECIQSICDYCFDIMHGGNGELAQKL